MKKKLVATFAWGNPLFLVSLLLLGSCASTGVSTLRMTHYGLVGGPSQAQTKSDIEITLKTIRYSDIYQYPDLFAFDVEEHIKEYPTLKSGLSYNYPKGHQGKSWEYPFFLRSSSETILLYKVKIKNSTKHILRMRDARIYLVPEGQDPISALASFEDLLDQADYFEKKANEYLASTRGILNIPIPTGFYRSFVSSHKKGYKLINDLSKEILPGFSYEGILAFPASSTEISAKISFFDITTKTDPAGNPLEKTQFDYDLQRQDMWYDSSEKIWKSGTPPAQ